MRTEKERQGAFDAFYGEWMRNLLADIEEKLTEAGCPVPLFDSALKASWLGVFQRISLRTLILEMQICAKCGCLKGETPEQQYQYYETHFLSDREYRRELEAEYPLLFLDMNRCAAETAENIVKLCERFAQDRAEINRRFFPQEPCERVEVLSGSNSDRHNGGKQVFILELDNGRRLIYKPRSLAVEEAYRRFLFRIAEGIGVSYWWNQALDRGDYGWCEWVSGESCQSMEELRAYYLRNGMLLCLSYLLGSGDLHYENLIAHGAYPVIVDLEMGLGSRQSPVKERRPTETERIYQECVLHTGLLPLSVWGKDGEGINVSALDGKGGQLLPIKTPVVVNAGRADMHIEYRYPKTQEAKNLARLNGVFIEPYRFLEQIESGFVLTYRFLLQNRTETEAFLTKLGKAPIRYLLRDTQVYQMILMASYHPNYLVSQPERLRFLAQIQDEQPESASFREWQLRQEVRALYNGDIPYFWYTAEEKSLHAGRTEVWDDFFAVPLLKELKGRLKRLSENDLNRQLRLIRNALFLGTKRVNEPAARPAENKVLPCGIGDGKKTAEQIGGILRENAIWSEDREDVGWICMSLAGFREQGFYIRPMGMYLYDGVAGAAVFLQRLAKVSTDGAYRELAAKLIDKLFAYTRQAAKAGEGGATGAYSGEASIAYAYQLLYRAGGEAIFLEYMERQCRYTAGLLKQDKTYDLLGGNAGAIAVFLNAWQLTGDRQYVQWACEAGDCLLRQAALYEWGWGWINPTAETALTGMAHGASGIMLALARLGAVTGDARYQEAAYQAWRFEEHYYEAEKEDWKDLRFPEEISGHAHQAAWCHGWGGIYLARKQCLKYADAKLKKELAKPRFAWEKKLAAMGQDGSYCLCHGKCGALAVLSAAGQPEAAKKWRQRMLADISGGAEAIRSVLGLQECETYGLMSGISGIGYSCLCSAQELERLLLAEI